jgi:hypothetical protein
VPITSVTVPPDVDAAVVLLVVVVEDLDELPQAARATTEPSARNALKADLVCLLTSPPPQRVFGRREI